jgi:DNA-binding LacI/PurR family transcriptional regulator
MERASKHPKIAGPVTLKIIAAKAGVTAGTVSAVLNSSPASHAIPAGTRERIRNTARALNYRPNFFARSLRKKPTHLVGVIAGHLGDLRTALIMAGIESQLREKNYLFIAGVHQQDAHLLEKYVHQLLQNGVEGFILVDFQYEHLITSPTVTVGSRVSAHRVEHDVLLEDYTDGMPMGMLDRSDVPTFHAPLLKIGRSAARLLLERIESSTRGSELTNLATQSRAFVSERNDG